MPTVSIIVTTFNRKEYLTETIQSILNQSFQDFELIVVDNYSNYDFFALIESFKNEKVIPIQNLNNGVIAVNRNVGIEHAKGKYLAFCDDDDLWFPEKIEKQLHHLKSHNADVIYTHLLCFNEKGSNYIRKAKQLRNISQLIRKNEISLSTVFLKNNKLIKFDEDPNLVTVEDYFLWLNLYISGLTFVLLNEPTTKYRLSPNSMFAKQKYQIYLRLNLGFTKLLINNQFPILITFAFLKKMILNLIKLQIKNLFASK